MKDRSLTQQSLDDSLEVVDNANQEEIEALDDGIIKDVIKQVKQVQQETERGEAHGIEEYEA